MSQEQRPEDSTTYGEPEVRFVEEIGEDGKKIRKKITTRKVTHRVVTAVPTTTTTTTVTSSSSATSSSSEHVHVEESATISSKSSSNTEHHATIEAAATSESEKESTVSSSTAAAESGTLKQRLSREIHNHPYYRFLSRFPLKTWPAQFERPKLVKPVIYCFGSDQKSASAGKGEDNKEKKGTQDSFDVDSLVWITYLKFNKIDFDIKCATEPTMSPDGKLPFLALPSGELITHAGFEQWVRENSQADATKLSLHEAAEASAFSTLIETKLLTALNYTLWFELAHFKTATRQRYFGHHNKYLGILLSYLRKSEVVQRMLLAKPQVDRELIFEEASAALEALSVALGKDNKGFFFGKKEPSSLDAILFAYLHVILRLPPVTDLHQENSTPENAKATELTRMVRKHDNLVQYAVRVWNECFA